MCGVSESIIAALCLHTRSVLTDHSSLTQLVCNEWNGKLKLLSIVVNGTDRNASDYVPVQTTACIEHVCVFLWASASNMGWDFRCFRFRQSRKKVGAQRKPFAAITIAYLLCSRSDSVKISVCACVWGATHDSVPCIECIHQTEKCDTSDVRVSIFKFTTYIRMHTIGTKRQLLWVSVFLLCFFSHLHVHDTTIAPHSDAEKRNKLHATCF